MLNGLFNKLPDGVAPLFHSDQGWQYQHAEYQRLLTEHNITQSMSRKGNCMDNGAMENFFGRLKVEMFYGEEFESVDDFIHELNEYIHYYNNERISSKLKMSPVQQSDLLSGGVCLFSAQNFISVSVISAPSDGLYCIITLFSFSVMLKSLPV